MPDTFNSPRTLTISALSVAGVCAALALAGFWASFGMDREERNALDKVVCVLSTMVPVLGSVAVMLSRRSSSTSLAPLAVAGLAFAFSVAVCWISLVCLIGCGMAGVMGPAGFASIVVAPVAYFTMAVLLISSLDNAVRGRLTTKNGAKKERERDQERERGQD